jgi:hypothetical protein
MAESMFCVTVGPSMWRRESGIGLKGTVGLEDPNSLSLSVSRALASQFIWEGKSRSSKPLSQS